MKSAKSILLLIVLGVSMITAFAQGQGVKEELIDDKDQFVVSFHRPIVDEQGDLILEKAGKKVKVGNALKQEQISAGFKVGDRVVIRVKAPVDCYTYVVNNSKWDGSTLVTNGKEIKKGEEQDFVYRLTNEGDKQGIGAEELLFLFRRKPFDPKEVEQFLISQGKDKTPKIKLKERTDETDQFEKEVRERQKRSKGAVVVSVACKVASIFFPWVGAACGVTGFAGADPVPLPGEEIGLKPEKDAENLLVQFSFPIIPA